MTSAIGWHFPPNGGGLGDGYNDSGIATFAGNRLRSLARETIQNSLDAAQSNLQEPVHVSFELIELNRDQEIGRQELQLATQASLEASVEDPEEHRQALSSAMELLKKPKLTFLRISDRNTTGLRGSNWLALVKMRGASRKDNLGAGGSHGIGKHATFAVSPLRTVFYWTCYEENGRQFEKFQGRSILRSHEGLKGQTQGTGFFGYKEGCRELNDQKIIPRHFRICDTDNRPIVGTSLWIAGFQGRDGWQRGIAGSVIESFFYAIQTGKLTVNIKPNNEIMGINLPEINKFSLEKWFNWISQDSGKCDENGESDLREAWKFSELTRSQEPAAETQDPDFGHCRLYVQVKDGLPSKAALIRATGMLITTEQKRLARFSGLQDFAAVCVFDGDEGNKLLRKMENPQHDKFEPDRLPEKERKKGRKALNRIVDWIREEIKKKAKPPQSKEITLLGELARVLPDIEPDEEFGEGSNRERSFDKRPSIKLQPRRKPRYDNPNPKKNPPDSKRIHGRLGRTVPIHDLRVIPLTGVDNRCRVSFMSHWSGKARLQFAEAGDSTDIPRDDIRAFKTNGKKLDLGMVVLKEGKQCIFEIESDQPIRNRAYCLQTRDVKSK